MTIRLKNWYYIGMGIYLFSFCLPADSVYHKTYYGYHAAFYTFEGLFIWEGVIPFFHLLFLNAPNLIMIANSILQFSMALRKLLFFQIIALISSLQWTIYSPFSVDHHLSDLKAGYWLWVFSILLITLVMLKDYIRGILFKAYNPNTSKNEIKAVSEA